jgi:putative spermidine/putrescine transport system permease protein
MKNFLIYPLLLLLGIFFAIPIGNMLIYSVYNTKVEMYLPNTTKAFTENKDVYEAYVLDLKDEKSMGVINYLNHYYSESRSLIIKTRKNIDQFQPPYKQSLEEFDERYKDPKFWEVLENETHAFTLENYKIIFSQFDSVYFQILYQTLYLGMCITFVTVLISYPTAYYLTTIKNRWLFLICIFSVLLPFFTNYLSRLVAWLVLLQQNGLINQFIEYVGLSKISLMNNTLGIFIGSIYILLPLAILPIYTTMKKIKNEYYKTGQILGGSKIQIFRYVYFPMTAIGVYNAIILVFMTVIGFYLTPALLGGSKGKFITEQIVYNIEQTLNWGLATALTSTLFFVVMLLFGIYAKLNKGITHA